MMDRLQKPPEALMRAIAQDLKPVRPSRSRFTWRCEWSLLHFLFPR